MTTKKPNIFNSSKLIITEGEDDAHFILSFIKKFDASLLNKIHIHWVNGNTKLFTGDKFNEAENKGMMGLQHMLEDKTFMNNVLDIAVIFDAEKSAQKTFDLITKQFQQAKEKSAQLDEYQQKIIFNLPKEINEFVQESPKKLSPNVSIFLFDKGDGTGTLEDLYLSTLGDHDKTLIHECIEEKLIGCLNAKHEPINDQKVKVQTFLAVKDPSWKSIGFVASKDKIDFEKSDSLLKDLKEFLIGFANLK